MRLPLGLGELLSAELDRLEPELLLGDVLAVSDQHRLLSRFGGGQELAARVSPAHLVGVRHEPVLDVEALLRVDAAADLAPDALGVVAMHSGQVLVEAGRAGRVGSVEREQLVRPVHDVALDVIAPGPHVTEALGDGQPRPAGLDLVAQAYAVDRAAQVPAHVGEHVEQELLGPLGRPRKELEDPLDPLRADNRHRESPGDAAGDRGRLSRILAHVRAPQRPAGVEGAAGQPGAGRQGRARRRLHERRHALRIAAVPDAAGPERRAVRIEQVDVAQRPAGEVADQVEGARHALFGATHRAGQRGGSIEQAHNIPRVEPYVGSGHGTGAPGGLVRP